MDYDAEPLPEINFSNWPLYMDKAKDNETGERYSPSLRAFEEQTGLTVNYNDEINENASFFGELQPQFEAGQDTGRDIIVMSRRASSSPRSSPVVGRRSSTRRSDRTSTRTPRRGRRTLSTTRGTASRCRGSPGITSIGYNTELVNGTITKMDDLLDSNITGVGKVGVLRQDAPDFVMINLGIDPLTSTPDDWQEAANWLTMLRDSDSFRAPYRSGLRR